MTRLNRSRIKYTPGLCGTSCTFFCKSGFCFLDAAMRPQIYVRCSQLETRPCAPLPAVIRNAKYLMSNDEEKQSALHIISVIRASFVLRHSCFVITYGLVVVVVVS